MSIALLGCSENRIEEAPIKDDSELKKDLKIIANERVFFGHQSVGSNILGGLAEIIKENPEVKLNLMNCADSMHLSKNYFIGEMIGENNNPNSKFDEFADKVEKLSSSNLNIALMKLCFLDVVQQADIDRILDEYASIIDSLRQKHSSIIFVHVTVPLTAEAGIARRIYRSLRGRVVDYAAENTAREKFNEKLRQRYLAEPIFDLAVVESTHPDGTREKEMSSTDTYYSLVKEYASDEGHLNDYGSKIAARELVRTLANAARDHKINE